jgi:hypothetical protein
VSQVPGHIAQQRGIDAAGRDQGKIGEREHGWRITGKIGSSRSQVVDYRVERESINRLLGVWDEARELKRNWRGSGIPCS